MVDNIFDSVVTCRYVAGALEYYDKKYDRVSAKNEKKLLRINRAVHSVTTTDDPIIRKVCPLRPICVLTCLHLLPFL